MEKDKGKRFVGEVGKDCEIILTKHPIREGGPGSGNFQHAGRPGEVGGSDRGGGVPSIRDVVKASLGISTKGSEKNPVKPGEYDTYFHGTSSKVLKSIVRDGLLPMGRSQLTFGNKYYNGSRMNSVFLTDDKDLAAFWGSSTASRRGATSVIVFEVRVPRAELENDTVAGPGHYYYKKAILPENIKGFWVLPHPSEWTGKEWSTATHGKLHELRKGEIFYVPVVISNPTKEQLEAAIKKARAILRKRLTFEQK